VYGRIAEGGMGAVHYGRLIGSAGFSRTVAIKRAHPHLARDTHFSEMLRDEARLAGRVRHPNVVSTLDVVSADEELLLVMEYVHGDSLSHLVRQAAALGKRMPPKVVAAIVCDVLHGLHAAHEAKDERAQPLNIVHRDVSPQNILVGADGIARVLDFGVAKAVGRLQTTGDGRIKGKLAYMAVEQINSGPVDRRTDVYSAGVILWEALTGTRLFSAGSGEDQGATIQRVLTLPVPPPSEADPGLSRAYDAVVLRALSRDPSKRYGTAQQMAIALEACDGVASRPEVASWVELLAADTLAQRAREVEAVEHPDVVVTIPSAEEKRTGDIPTITAISSNSPTQAPTPPSAPERRRPWAAFAILVLALGIGGLFVLRLRPTTAAAGGATPAASASSSPSAGERVVAADPPVVNVSELPIAPPVPAPSASAVTAASRQHPPRTAPAPRAAGHAPAASPPASPQDCPLRPYTDADGIVRFRRQCGD
jgi:eukaryotic-like serine/threonine-protein kinase